MADFYSSFFGEIPRSATSAGAIITSRAYAQKGPNASRAGETLSLYVTYTNTTANPFGGTAGDTLHLAQLPPGGKVIYLGVGASADMDTNNDFTFDLGVTGAISRYAAASTALQATTPLELDFSDQFPDAVAGANVELLLTRAAGSLEAAGIITVYAQILIP